MRTGVVDALSVVNNSYTKSSMRNKRMITSTAFQLNMAYEFMTEERYSFKVSVTNMWLTVRNPEIILNENFKNQIRTVSFEGFYNLNQENTSGLFFHWRLNSQDSNSKLNFNQVQLGYLVDIFKTSSSSK